MNIPDLSIEERIKLVEDIWDSIVLDKQALPVTNRQREELDRRLAQYVVDGQPGAPADLVIERIKSRL